MKFCCGVINCTKAKIRLHYVWCQTSTLSDDPYYMQSKQYIGAAKHN